MILNGISIHKLRVFVEAFFVRTVRINIQWDDGIVKMKLTLSFYNKDILINTLPQTDFGGRREKSSCLGTRGQSHA